jgi:iron complex transport system ATP-binding protein
MTNEPALCLRNVHFSYRGRAVLRGVGFDLDHGEIVSLLGANGAGKSTLLRLAIGLIAPTSGEVLLDGRPIGKLPRRAIARKIAYVPQSHVAPFPFEVREVVMLGRLAETGLFRRPSSVDRAAVAESLDQLGLSHLARRPYTEISGGERQLTLIARALAQGAELLVMDEPASGLDFGHHVRLLGRLKRLAAQGYGILMTTHHLDHALTTSTRVVLLKDGRVLRDGPPEQAVTPETIRRLYGVNIESFSASAFRLGVEACESAEHVTHG